MTFDLARLYIFVLKEKEKVIKGDNNTLLVHKKKANISLELLLISNNFINSLKFPEVANLNLLGTIFIRLLPYKKVVSRQK